MHAAIDGSPQSDRLVETVRKPALYASKNATARMKPPEPFSILYGKHEIQKPSAGSWSRVGQFLHLSVADVTARFMAFPYDPSVATVCKTLPGK